MAISICILLLISILSVAKGLEAQASQIDWSLYEVDASEVPAEHTGLEEYFTDNAPEVSLRGNGFPPAKRRANLNGYITQSTGTSAECTGEFMLTSLLVTPTNACIPDSAKKNRYKIQKFHAKNKDFMYVEVFGFMDSGCTEPVGNSKFMGYPHNAACSMGNVFEWKFVQKLPPIGTYPNGMNVLYFDNNMCDASPYQWTYVSMPSVCTEGSPGVYYKSTCAGLEYVLTYYSDSTCMTSTNVATVPFPSSCSAGMLNDFVKHQYYSSSTCSDIIVTPPPFLV